MDKMVAWKKSSPKLHFKAYTKVGLSKRLSTTFANGLFNIKSDKEIEGKYKFTLNPFVAFYHNLIKIYHS